MYGKNQAFQKICITAKLHVTLRVSEFKAGVFELRPGLINLFLIYLRIYEK